MTTVEVFGRIEAGKLIISNRKRFESDIAGCQDCEVEIIVRKRGKRSTQQNRYYWGVVVQEIRLRLKDLGHRLNAEEIHIFLKQKFLPLHIHDEIGTILATIPGSTAGLNKTQFSDYIEQIRQWAAEVLEIQVPDANSKKVDREIKARKLYLQAVIYGLGAKAKAELEGRPWKPKNHHIIAVDKVGGICVYTLDKRLLEYAMQELEHYVKKFNYAVYTEAWDESQSFYSDRWDGTFICEKSGFMFDSEF